MFYKGGELCFRSWFPLPFPSSSAGASSPPPSPFHQSSATYFASLRSVRRSSNLHQKIPSAPKPGPTTNCSPFSGLQGCPSRVRKFKLPVGSRCLTTVSETGWSAAVAAAGGIHSDEIPGVAEVAWKSATSVDFPAHLLGSHHLIGICRLSLPLQLNLPPLVRRPMSPTPE